MLIYFSDVQQKLGKLINFYEGIKDTTHFRTQSLENTLDVSERFWDDLHSLASTIKDLQDAITQQDPPALEPAVIREQQDYLEVCSVNLRLDLEVCSVNLKLDLEVCSVSLRLDLEVCSVNLRLDLEVCSVSLRLDLEVCSVNLRLDLEVCSVNLRLDLEVCSVSLRLDLEVCCELEVRFRGL